jgi:hypothetical protein
MNPENTRRFVLRVRWYDVLGIHFTYQRESLGMANELNRQVSYI